MLVKGSNGFNFENPLAIEKSVGLLAGDAMRSSDLLPWWGVQVAETGREKRLLKDVLMCFGGHQCADWTKIVGRSVANVLGKEASSASPIDVDDTRGGVMDRRCGVEKRGRCFVCKVALSHLKVGVNHARTSRQKCHLG